MAMASSSSPPLFPSSPSPNRRSLDSHPSSLAPPLLRPCGARPVRCRAVDWRPLRRLQLVRDLDHRGTVDVPPSVPVRVAHELLLAGHRYLDVRSEEEFSVGHAEGAVNVPYMLKFGTGMTKNPSFVEQVLLVFGKDAEIIVGCQNGKKSLMAATELVLAGFTGITDIAGGYAAWMQNGLPMEE